MPQENINLDFEKESRILIVDDNPQNIQVLGNILKECNYKISIAMNGIEALKFVSRNIPDLILLDVMMPEMDGYETCENIKSNELTNNIPVIFLTAKIETEDIVKGFEVGGVDYVTKPFRKEELLARVRTHLKLKKTENELMDLLSMKDRLFSIIGHDLRGPLGTLMMLMESLAAPDSNYNEAEIKKYMSMLKDSSKTAFDLLENLLNWARSQQKLVQYEPTVNNIKEIVDEDIKILKITAETKSISIKNNVDGALAAFFDKNCILTVLRNLISNALKFTQDGGSIKVSAKKSEDYIEISVTDSGVGMSRESVKKLFRKNLIQSTRGTSGEKGTGLGLLLCKDFVEGNNGKIWVESEEGRGTTILFTLPLAH
jgi:two-component system sensor histidine kinase/response regulator